MRPNVLRDFFWMLGHITPQEFLKSKSHILHNSSQNNDICIFCIFCIFGLNFSYHGWMPPSQLLSSSPVNQLTSCMLSQCPPYWGGLLLSRWAILERSPSRCEKNLLTFRGQVVIRQMAAASDVGGGM